MNVVLRHQYSRVCISEDAGQLLTVLVVFVVSMFRAPRPQRSSL
jgi:hypothetical protein